MKIYFENALGTVCLGSDKSFQWRISAVSGLGLVDKSFQTARYPFYDGQILLSKTTNGRGIGISGDILRNDSYVENLSKAITIFDLEGILKFDYGEKKRAIPARVTTFDLSKSNGAYQLFVMQLICDSPYFTDFEPITAAVYQSLKIIENTFTLPCVFSTRTSRSIIKNSGARLAEPCFYIHKIKKSEITSEVNGIYIKNHTTNQHIELNYDLAQGEIITIDIFKRRIRSSIADVDLLSKISDDTFLDDFWLDVGDNDVEVTNYNVNDNIAVICEFYNNFLEAVH